MKKIVKKVLNNFSENFDHTIYMKYHNTFVVPFEIRNREKQEICDRLEFYNSQLENDNFKPLCSEALQVISKDKKIGMSSFPFVWAKGLFKNTKINVYIDKKSKFKYLFLDNKKMFFPKDMTKKQVVEYFKFTQIIEQNEKSAHRYCNENFKIETGDILVDVGACEGNFSLANIDKAEKAYIIECEDKWVECLKKTFEPYKDKVIIIKKFVSDRNNENEITLDEIFKDKVLPTFIKADIEGAEDLMLSGAKNIISDSNNLKIAICVYHKKGDAQKYKDFFDNLNFKSHFSDGYMLFGTKKPNKTEYEFRKGVLRAFKKDDFK